MARALFMTCWKGIEGIARGVLEALLRHLKSSFLLGYGLPIYVGRSDEHPFVLLHSVIH